MDWSYLTYFLGSTIEQCCTFVQFLYKLSHTCLIFVQDVSGNELLTHVGMHLAGWVDKNCLGLSGDAKTML